MTRKTHTDGLHHITAISGGAARTQGFYTRVLGQRLVKRTVNFDDPGTWHLYYGDERGSAGTIMTFFPWEQARSGSVGAGQVSLTQYAVPAGSLDAWQARLVEAGVTPIARDTSFGAGRIVLADPDGLLLALVETTGDARAPWTGGDVPEAIAIRGFHGATLALNEEESTARILTGALGYAREGEEPAGAGRLVRYRAAGGGAQVIDLHVDPAMPRGTEGAGTVHHIAFSVPDRAAQAEVSRAMAALGHPTTPQIDRDYFFAIYARTPSGVLFEVATEEPGFTRDETLETLGTSLKIPDQHAHLRARIEAVLPPLEAAAE